MGVNYNSSVSTDGLVFYVDASNPKSYPGSGNIWRSLVGPEVVTLMHGPTFNGSAIQFREQSGITNTTQYGYTTLDYGILRQSGQTAQWSLEVCFKHYTPTSGNGNYVTSELVLIGRAGCHGGIYGYPTAIRGAIKTTSCWTGALNNEMTTVVNEGIYHAVFTYNDGSCKYYINGVLTGEYTFNYSAYATAAYSSTLYVGGINRYTPNADIYFAKAYTKELTLEDVQKNYYAVRERFGI